jgi:arsenate reductase (thioredoxin)
MNQPESPHLLSVDSVLHRAAEHLATRFTGVFSPESVTATVRESYDLLAANAAIHQHLPNRAVHFAADRLAAAAKVHGAVAHPRPEVLFVCVHNAGRSQMAAALLEHRSGGAVKVRSAGSAPAGSLDPTVLQAVAELGLNLTGAYPKPLTDEVVRSADAVVTMGCGDACPVYPGKRYLDWELPDPEGRDLDAVRAIRDEIDACVTALLAELTPAHA